MNHQEKKLKKKLKDFLKWINRVVSIANYVHIQMKYLEYHFKNLQYNINIKQPTTWDIDYAKGILNSEIEGLDKVKERIVEMISINKLKNAG